MAVLLAKSSPPLEVAPQPLPAAAAPAAASPAWYPAIRIGLKQVKGIARVDLESILRARQDGLFNSLSDFCRRTTVPRHVVENLILCGAFDSINPVRRQLLWELDEAMRVRRPAAAAVDQLCLTELDAPAPSCRGRNHPPARPTAAPVFPIPTLAERVRWDVDVLGFCVHTHPTLLFRPYLEPYGVITTAALMDQRDGKRVRVAGVVLCRMRPPTKSGAVVVFITLEDETGLVDAVIFPKVYDTWGKAAFASDLLVIEGRVQRQGARAITLIAERVFNPLDAVVPDRINGSTGFGRKELVIPGAEVTSLFAPPPQVRDFGAEGDEFHEDLPDPLAPEEAGEAA